MALDNKIWFSYIAGAAISIGCVLKLHAKVTEDKKTQASYPPMVDISYSSSNPLFLHKHAMKKYIT